MNALAESLKRSAIVEGFCLAGLVDIEPALAKAEALHAYCQKYHDWLEKGFFGTMEYLRRGEARRKDPRLLFPEAKSVLTVAWSYPPRAHRAGAPLFASFISGTSGRDYHVELQEKLEAALKRTVTELGLPLKWKIYVDTGAILERAWAAMAGLGWIGKNGHLLNAEFGSRLLLAEALLDHETGLGPQKILDRCGDCKLCLRACPTGAISEPRMVNASKCVSAWTLEKRATLELSETEKRQIGLSIAGCDVCLDACPYNYKKESLDSSPSESLGWRDSLCESEVQYKNRVKGTALERVKFSQMRRNLAIALANAALNDVKTDWLSLRVTVEQQLNGEADEASRSEWRRCLDAIDHRLGVKPNSENRE